MTEELIAAIKAQTEAVNGLVDVICELLDRLDTIAGNQDEEPTEYLDGSRR